MKIKGKLALQKTKLILKLTAWQVKSRRLSDYRY